MTVRVLLACVLTLAIPSSVHAQIRAEVVAAGLESPLGLVPDPVDPGVLYILEQQGRVRVLQHGVLLTAPFLDLRTVIASGGERGLLGMAFPPDAAASGRVFVHFTDLNGDTVIARFRRSGANPLVVDPATRLDFAWPGGERVIRQPFANHNGGHLAFGPDGYLYVGLGDGGSGNDPLNAAQDPATLLGKMLRLDVSVPDGDPMGYRAPVDNPFVDGQPIAALTEIWAFGLRNPWRFSFDDVGAGATGALIIGDVGQGAREEVNYEPYGAGGRNYGWRMREGTIPTPGVPPTTPAYLPLTDPIYDYPHSEGRAVTGGYVYRGTALPASYRGRYFFADYVRARVWSMALLLHPATGEATPFHVLEHTEELGGAAFLGGIASFGRDLQGELYLVTFAGRVLRIAIDPEVTPEPPRDVRAVVTGTTGVITWQPPLEGPPPAQYRLEAGSVPGGSDVAGVGASGNLTSLVFTGVGPGVYYVRMRSASIGGFLSAPSEEVVVIVTGPGCAAPPPAPLNFAASVAGALVRLAWDIPSTANGPTLVGVEAGSAPGVANLALIVVDGTLRGLEVVAPPGQYYVRMRSGNGCGISGVSNEIVVVVRWGQVEQVGR